MLLGFCYIFFDSRFNTVSKPISASNWHVTMISFQWALEELLELLLQFLYVPQNSDRFTIVWRYTSLQWISY